MKEVRAGAIKPVEQKKMGFFKRLFGAERGKRRTYRMLRKELASARIDLYRLRQDTISVPFVKLIYEIYKLTFPIKQFLQLDKTGTRLSPSFVEHFILRYHPRETLETYKCFSEEFITQLAEKNGLNQTVIQIKQLFTKYLQSFDQATIEKINRAYSNFLHFARFSNFDFFIIVREFDETLEKDNFLKKPSFSPAIGSLLREELYRLHLNLYMFTMDESIDNGIEVLGELKGTTPLSHHSLSRLKHLIEEMQTNQYLSLIIRAIDKRIAPLPIRKPNIVDIFHSFTVRKEKEIMMLLNSIKAKYREETISTIISQLFEQNISGRIKNYTDLKNDQLQALNLPTFKYPIPLNYCKAFLTDRYTPFIATVINELIVGGMFSDKNLLTSLSNNYYALNDSIPMIDELDDDLDIDGRIGRSLEKLIQKVPKDSGMTKLLEKMIFEQNIRAGHIITGIITNSRDMAFALKRILDDYKQKSQNLVVNLKKIRAQKNQQFIEDLVTCYRYLYLFLRLLAYYVPIKPAEPSKEKEELSKKETTDNTGPEPR
jgi:hypothetical protein